MQCSAIVLGTKAPRGLAHVTVTLKVTITVTVTISITVTISVTVTVKCQTKKVLK